MNKSDLWLSFSLVLGKASIFVGGYVASSRSTWAMPPKPWDPVRTLFFFPPSHPKADDLSVESFTNIS